MLSENGELIMKNQDIANTYNVGTIIENLRIIPVVRLSKNISKTTSLSLLDM